MLRGLYSFLIGLHPRPFRERFGDEMEWIFDQAAGVWPATHLMLDAVASVGRQWLLRGDQSRQLAAAGDPAGAPLFYFSPSEALPPSRLLHGALLSFIALAAVVYALGHGAGPVRRWLIGSHHPHHSHMLPVVPTGPPEALHTEVTVTADSALRRQTVLREFIRNYFRSILVADILDADHNLELSALEIANAPARLRLLDTDHDGKLTAVECGLRLPGSETSGLNPIDLARSLMGYDRNGDGVLSRAEVPARMLGLFERGDSNGDGILTVEEILLLTSRQAGATQYPRVDPSVLHRARSGFMSFHPILAVLDADHDGVISSQEMDNAPRALQRLDRNFDGRLASLEVLPGPVYNWVAVIFRLDSNGDGRISPAERTNDAGLHFKALLDAADRDKDGLVTEKELAAELRLRADLDQDGTVTWEEMLIAIQTGLILRVVR